ncbi:MAG TPA: hypothetical protein VHE35_01160 [Kofleriaceae bacterium]|nr:hypothetical protein [Kofleriaceae bacterium]
MRAIVLVMLVGACGTARDNPPAGKAAPGPTPTPTPTPTARVPEATPTPPAPPAPPPAPAPPARDLGSCELTVEGAVTGHDTVPRDRASVLTDYWLGDTERAQLEASTSGTTAAVADALELLTLNCEGQTARLSIVPGQGASTKTIPFGPHTYRLDKGKGALGVLGHVGDSLFVEPTGTIDVTAFDAHHIAATIDLAGTTMDRRAVHVTGKLDYLCDGLSGCK